MARINQESAVPYDDPTFDELERLRAEHDALTARVADLTEQMRAAESALREHLADHETQAVEHGRHGCDCFLCYVSRAALAPAAPRETEP